MCHLLRPCAYGIVLLALMASSLWALAPQPFGSLADESLMAIVLSSRNNPQNGPQAALAISELNRRQYDFQWKDLSMLHLPGAQLQKAKMSRCNCRGTVFNGANLQGADVRQAQFQDTDLSDVQMGQDQWWHSELRRRKEQSEGELLTNEDEGPDDPHALALAQQLTAIIANLLHDQGIQDPEYPVNMFEGLDIQGAVRGELLAVFLNVHGAKISQMSA